jgi:chromatin segregation and condensation protein Rec8/ScpA/Scc1 (kleisin family)
MTEELLARLDRIEARIDILERGLRNQKQRCKNHRRNTIEVQRQVAGIVKMIMQESDYLEKIEKEKAKARSLANLKQGTTIPDPATLPTRKEGEVRDIVSEKVGMKPCTYEKYNM